MTTGAETAIDPETAANIAHARSLPGRTHAERLFPVRPFAALLAEQAAARGDAEFLRFRDDDASESSVLSWTGFEVEVRRTAAALVGLGVSRGDRIATVLSNHPDAVVLYFAAWTIGACLSPVNPGEDDARVRYVVENAEATHLFARPEHVARMSKLLPLLPRVRASVQVGGESGDWPRLSDLAAAADPSARLPAGEADDEALLVYTSGTTGPPKGVVLTQYNLLADAWAISRWQSIGPETRMMCVLPLHHVNGITVTLVTPAFTGASVTLCRKFFARSFWRTLAEDRIAVVSVVPTVLQFLLEADDDLSGLDLSRFRHFVCGAGTLSVALAQKFEDRFGFRVLHGYGMSEGTCYSCFLPTDLPPEVHRGWLRDHGYPSIGCAIEANEMAIHDAAGHALPPGEKGEIVYRGHNVMTGYFKRPEANREAFANGYFRSGDEGFRLAGPDGRDFYFITGRLKELINRGGVKYSPFEIEEVLGELPAVRTALVVGFENKYYGEEVGAYLVLHPGKQVAADEVVSFCRRRMPFAKCPKVVVFGTEIPVTSTGKFQRLQLRPLFSAWTDAQFRDGGGP